MGSTFFSLHYHLVFSTKERRPYIKPEWQPRLHAYLGGIIKGYIATQDAHHRKRSFVDEWRELLNAAGIEFDEKTFPVVFADSDHRLLSCNPSGCAGVSQLYKCR